MSPNFPGFRALSSKPLEIKSSNRSYFIHSDILESRLVSLHRADTGDAADKIDLSDWDSDTVGLFALFLYTGDYALESLLDRDEDGGWQDTADSLADRGASDVNVLLVHARVYSLAQSKDIEVLRGMAFERLKVALEGIDRRMLGGISRVTANVVELLAYVYPHTSPEEPMRGLVSTFAAENIEKLMGRGELSRLLREEGDFAVELMERVSGRVCDTGRLCILEKEVQDLKDRVAASDEKVQQLEAANEEKERQLKAANAEVEQLKAANPAPVPAAAS